MKVYVVESHYGYFNEKRVVLNGIFTDDKAADDCAEKIRTRYRTAFRMGDPTDNVEDWMDLSLSDLHELHEMQKDYHESIKYNGTIVNEYELPRHHFDIQLML